ncbi:hypothetical protein D3C87_1503480 [compost metagenome]
MTGHDELRVGEALCIEDGFPDPLTMLGVNGVDRIVEDDQRCANGGRLGHQHGQSKAPNVPFAEHLQRVMPPLGAASEGNLNAHGVRGRQEQCGKLVLVAVLPVEVVVERHRRFVQPRHKLRRQAVTVLPEQPKKCVVGHANAHIEFDLDSFRLSLLDECRVLPVERSHARACRVDQERKLLPLGSLGHGAFLETLQLVALVDSLCTLVRSGPRLGIAQLGSIRCCAELLELCRAAVYRLLQCSPPRAGNFDL